MPERLIPHWLAWPAGVLAIVAALGGSGLMFAAAAFGEYHYAAWATAAFAGGGVCWFIGDMAADNRPID